jgi:hypothetical protein
MLKELTFGYCFSEIWFSCACNVVGENAMENRKDSESTELVAQFDFILRSAALQTSLKASA